MNRRTALGLALLVGISVGVRSLPPAMSPGAMAWWPWAATTVTLFFSDGRFIVPVSRHMPRRGDLPRAALQALLDGPSPESGLRNPVPRGVGVRSVDVRDGVARVDLSTRDADAFRTGAAEEAIVQTMTGLPGVTSVSVSVNGKSVVDQAARAPLLYYPSANGLVAVPTSAAEPRGALTRYLAGPPDARLTGLPAGVRVIDYGYNERTGLLSINLSYTPSVRTLAIEQPDRMRLVLLGLVASLTEFPSVRMVRLDFEGHGRLGLGQCSDLLQTPQPRPDLLNDERLLGRGRQTTEAQSHRETLVCSAPLRLCGLSGDGIRG